MAEEGSVAIVAIVIVAVLLVFGAAFLYRDKLLGSGPRIVEATTVIGDNEPSVREREIIRENNTIIRENRTIVHVPSNNS